MIEDVAKKSPHILLSPIIGQRQDEIGGHPIDCGRLSASGSTKKVNRSAVLDDRGSIEVMVRVSTVAAAREARAWCHTTSHARANTWTGASSHSVIGAKHSNPGSKLRSPERDHVFPDVSSHHLSMLCSGVVENPLDQVVAVLITGNVNERDASPIPTALTDAIEVSAQELTAADLQTLFHNL